MFVEFYKQSCQVLYGLLVGDPLPYPFLFSLPFRFPLPHPAWHGIAPALGECRTRPRTVQHGSTKSWLACFGRRSGLQAGHLEGTWSNKNTDSCAVADVVHFFGGFLATPWLRSGSFALLVKKLDL